MGDHSNIMSTTAGTSKAAMVAEAAAVDTAAAVSTAGTKTPADELKRQTVKRGCGMKMRGCGGLRMLRSNKALATVALVGGAGAYWYMNKGGSATEATAPPTTGQ